MTGCPAGAQWQFILRGDKKSDYEAVNHESSQQQMKNPSHAILPPTGWSGEKQNKTKRRVGGGGLYESVFMLPPQHYFKVSFQRRRKLIVCSSLLPEPKTARSRHVSQTKETK